MDSEITTAAIAQARRYLDARGAGAVDDVPELVRLLTPAWDALSGAEERTEAWKLGRMEAARWSPPILTFDLERHGALMMGSTRAEVHTWAVNLDTGQAKITGQGHRQVEKMAPRLKTEPLVSEIVAMIEAGQDDPRLSWSPDRGSIQISLSKVVGEGNKQTAQGRRRRISAALDTAMLERGWVSSDDRGQPSRVVKGCRWWWTKP